jgi:hypothetical protein
VLGRRDRIDAVVELAEASSIDPTRPNGLQ